MLCDCEQVQQSEYSPGLVEDQEDIVYCLIDPDLFDRNASKLKNKAFSKSELRKTELSVVRKRHSNRAEVQEKVIDPQVARNPARHFIGVYVCKSSRIRGIDGTTGQDFCIADAGLDGFASHAHLGFCEDLIRSNKSVQEAARSNLVAAFQSLGIKGLETVFDE